MAIPLIPWEPHVFPVEIQQELNRRSINRNLKFVSNSDDIWSSGGEWSTYRGPMTSWVRLCSNGYGSEDKRVQPTPKPGFVLYGGQSFYTAFGIGQPASPEYGINPSIIGYTPEGVPHLIANDPASSQYPIFVPPPEIEKVSAIIQKEMIRRVTIDWVCFSFKQLEYMTPYFLVPGITCIVEWGWNHFNPISLLDLTDVRQLSYLYNNPYSLYTQNTLNSKGNYEVVFGLVTNFEWAIEGNKIRCKTEITSKDRLWAGLVVNSNMMKNDEADPKPTETSKDPPVIDSFSKFVSTYIDDFGNFVTDEADETKTLLATTELGAFVTFLKSKHPKNWKSYLYGVFKGRDIKTNVQNQKMVISETRIKGFKLVNKPPPTEVSKVANHDYDFDCTGNNANVWLNMGLLVELVNFFSSGLLGTNNKELFRVDVEDCVINGHPNLISTDGEVLLIPNEMAPKFFSGDYGQSQAAVKNSEYSTLMNPCDLTYKMAPEGKLSLKDTAKKNDHLYDYVLKRVCLPVGNETLRDDHNWIINANRLKLNRTSEEDHLEFPFNQDYEDSTDGQIRVYKGLRTGFVKNLYINNKVIKEILKDGKVKTFPQFYEELFRRISAATAQFWELKLVASTGRKATGDLATMKIIDDKMGQYTSNQGDVYVFDYYGADSVLQAINFRPTLSNAQAIRTIYAPTNIAKKQKIILSDVNELLDYHFQDRLFKRNDQTDPVQQKSEFKSASFTKSMATLQSIVPPSKFEKNFQMTIQTPNNGIVIYRLAIHPDYSDILKLLLDDGDLENNPRYTGIMPGIQAEFTIQGIAGIRTFSMFLVRGLPEPYSEQNVVFRTINVTDNLQGGNWTTTITAGILPLRGYIKSKLGLSKGVVNGQNRSQL